ncbi:unnamed protein product, partial [Ectocarpus fasciculatus]
GEGEAARAVPAGPGDSVPQGRRRVPRGRYRRLLPHPGRRPRRHGLGPARRLLPQPPGGEELQVLQERRPEESLVSRRVIHGVEQGLRRRRPQRRCLGRRWCQ